MILYGKPVAEKIQQKLRKEIAQLKEKNIIPSLAVILIGDDPVSLSYVKNKEETAEKLGINFRLYHLPSFSTETSLIALIEDLNQNKFINGIIVQLPLPKGFNVEKIIKTISSQKDVDGFSERYPAPTAQAILEMFKFYKINLEDKKIVLIGHGRLVGKPLEKLLTKRGIQPIVCDSKTKNLAEKTIGADVIISATGQPNLIRQDMISRESIIIDAGASELQGKIRGDLNYETYQKAKMYSPVPGGVGPVTIAMLMKNLLQATRET